MTRLQRLESKGWNVSVFMSGEGAQASKGNTTIKGTSITHLHKQIIGY